MRWHLGMACTTLLSISAAPGAASVIRVPEDYPSVLAGVDAAVAGDSVLVGPGTWADTEVRTIAYFGTAQVAMVLKPGVTVIGVAGAQATILDGGEYVSRSVVTVVHATPGVEPARVVGFTITGGGDGIDAGGNGGGNSLALDGCRIFSNDYRGLGSRGGTVALTDCEVSENEFAWPEPRQGAVWGIDVILTCDRTRFEHNAGPALGLHNAKVSLGTLVLRDCTFMENRARAALIDYVPVEIERCLFLRNSTPTFGGGALLLTRCTGSIRFCTFAYDTSATGGGGLMVDGWVQVENNTFDGCHGGGFAGNAMVVYEDGGVRNNIVTFSTGPGGAVRKIGGPSNPTTGCNLFWGNESGDYYGDWVPAETDIHLYPRYCDRPLGNYTLQESSPAAPAHSGGCGLVGAFDVACGTVSVEPQSWGRMKALYR